MGVTTRSDAEYTDDGDAHDLEAITQAMQQSIDAKLVNYRTTTGTRTSKNSAFVAAGTKGMVEIVEDYGLSYYDGNSIPGSGGWRWVAAHRVLVSDTNFTGSANVTIPTVATTGSFTLDSKRLLLVEVSAICEIDTTSTNATLVNLNVDTTGFALPPFNLQSSHTFAGVAGRQTPGRSIRFGAGPGTGSIFVTLQKNGGPAGTVVSVAQGFFQVTDLGPYY